MIIEFDFEIYKRGDYDKVYLRNGCFDELCEKIRVKRDRIYNMEIISLSDDKATV